ncbi:spore germination protein AC [Bacillus thuringiensis serovar kurstaki str. HD-1]|nr:spore germination protein AC [Bacillus thuringiensis serovar kurstaki str. HD-1]
MVVIQNLAGKNKYDIDQTGDIPKVKIHLKLNGLIKNSPNWLYKGYRLHYSSFSL